LWHLSTSRGGTEAVHLIVRRGLAGRSIARDAPAGEEAPGREHEAFRRDAEIHQEVRFPARCRRLLPSGAVHSLVRRDRNRLTGHSEEASARRKPTCMHPTSSIMFHGEPFSYSPESCCANGFPLGRRRVGLK